MRVVERVPSRAVRWSASALAGVLLAPWVGAALSFVLVFSVLVVPLLLPFALAGAWPRPAYREPPRVKRVPSWGPVGEHAVAH